jgi:hypothetical protein
MNPFFICFLHKVDVVATYFRHFSNMSNKVITKVPPPCQAEFLKFAACFATLAVTMGARAFHPQKPRSGRDAKRFNLLVA